MSLSVSGTSGVVNTLLAPAAGSGSTAAPVDFGPAAVFTPSVFNGAAELQMYNSAGAAVGVALTQWLTSGTLPAPTGAGSTSGDQSDGVSSAAAT
jgi:hypothetical protein